MYSLAVSIMTYLSLFQFGFGATYLRYYVKFTSEESEQKIKDLNGMFLIIFSVMASVAVAIGLILLFNVEAFLGGNVTPDEHVIIQRLLSILIFQLAISIIGIPFSSLVTAHEKFIFQRGIRLCEVIVRVAILLPLLLSGFKSVAVVTVTTVLMTMVLLLDIWLCITRLKVRFRFSNFDIKLFKEMGGFAFFIFLQGVMDIFNWQMDKFLVARFWGANQVAVYAVAAHFNMMLVSFSIAISDFFIPKVNKVSAQNQSSKIFSDLLVLTGRIQFFIIAFIMISFVFFGRSAVFFFAGTGYENSYYIALLLMVPLVMPLSMTLVKHILRAKAKHQVLISLSVGVSFLNFLISIPLSRMYGGIGAAIGTFVGITITNIIQYIYAQRVGNLDVKRWIKEIYSIIPSFIVPIIFGFIILIAVDTFNLAAFLIWGILFSFVYIVSIWLFGMNHQEKMFFITLFQRLPATGRK